MLPCVGDRVDRSWRVLKILRKLYEILYNLFLLQFETISGKLNSFSLNGTMAQRCTFATSTRIHMTQYALPTNVPRLVRGSSPSWTALAFRAGGSFFLAAAASFFLAAAAVAAAARSACCRFFRCDVVSGA